MNLEAEKAVYAALKSVYSVYYPSVLRSVG